MGKWVNKRLFIHKVDDVRKAMQSMKESNIRVLDKEPKVLPYVFSHFELVANHSY